MRLSLSLRLGAAGVTASLIWTGCGGQNAPPVASGVSDLAPVHAARSAGESSVTYQVDTNHDGHVRAMLHKPLTVLWSVNLGGAVGYPVVANGIVVVAAGSSLIALDATNGQTLWTQVSPSDSWVGPAYDRGMIFSDPFYTFSSDYMGMFAFDEASGKQVWSSQTLGQYAFSSPPTAASGMVYTAAAGVGGTVYAFKDSDGILKWSAPVENGDDSSPVVTKGGVYVSYACPQTYDFNPLGGAQIWHYSGPCEGGGGSTPVLYDGSLFVEDSNAYSGYDGLILSAANGKAIGGFNATYPPAFAQHRGFLVGDNTLAADAIPSMKPAWSVTLSGGATFVTPALVAGNVVYVETSAGYLVGYDTGSGKQSINMNLGYSGYNRGLSVGLGYGPNELIVPDGDELIALQGSQK